MFFFQLFNTFGGSCTDMDKNPTTISERYIHSNNHTAENNTIQKKHVCFFHYAL